MQSPSAEQETFSWWRELIADPPCEIGETMRIESFARKCYRLFFDEKLSKARYFHICAVVWMVKLVEDEEISPRQICKSLFRCLEEHNQEGDNHSIASWVLPHMEPMDLQSDIYSFDNNYDDDNDDLYDDDLRYLARLGQFWKRFYEACANGQNSRPINRQRTTFGDLMKGSYKVPASFLLATIIKDCCCSGELNNWTALHDEVHKLPKYFKAFTVDDIQAGLTLVGLDCCYQGKPMDGLTSPWILREYITRTGESILSVLQEATQLNCYSLRASICEHLLEPIYSVEDEVEDEDKREALEQLSRDTIRACSEFINKEYPTLYIKNLSADTPSTATSRNNKKRLLSSNATDDGSSRIPSKVTSLGYPLLTHVDVLLLQDNVWRVAELVRRMNASPVLDGETKEMGWLRIWQYLLRNGTIFLDGNQDTPGYYSKRELLYTVVVSDMAYYGTEAMIDYFQELAKKIWNHPEATLNEKHYVLVASQHTLLRLFFKCFGLGSKTVEQFLKRNDWPVPLSTNGMASLEEWASDFLRRANPIPESLLNESGAIDLNRLTEAEEPKNTSIVVLDDEEEEVVAEVEEMNALPPIREEIEEGEGDVIELEESDKDEVQVDEEQEASVEEVDADEEVEVEEVDEDDEHDGEGEYDVVDDEDDKCYEEDRRYSGEEGSKDDVVAVEEGAPAYAWSEGEEAREEPEREKTDEESVEQEEEEELSENADHSADVVDVDEVDQVEDEDVEKEAEENQFEPPNDAAAAMLALTGQGVTHDDTSDVEMSSPNHVEEASVEPESSTLGSPERGVANAPIELVDSSPEKSTPTTKTNVEPMEDDYPQSGEGNASKDGNVVSDATDGGQERVQEVEKDETEVAAVGDEFGDTTEEEEDAGGESGKRNQAAEADRRVDAFRAETGYASQLEDGYEPEDVHGYTEEEEVSDAIHTEDEEEESRTSQAQPSSDAQVVGVDYSRQNNVQPATRATAHSSDDMDAADEHTEQEEDLGAESSELVEPTLGHPRIAEYTSHSDPERDPIALEDFARSAQRRHEPSRLHVPTPKKDAPYIPQHPTDVEGEGQSSEEKRAAEPLADKSVGFVDAGKATTDGPKDIQEVQGESDAPHSIDATPTEEAANADSPSKEATSLATPTPEYVIEEGCIEKEEELVDEKSTKQEEDITKEEEEPNPEQLEEPGAKDTNVLDTTGLEVVEDATSQEKDIGKEVEDQDVEEEKEEEEEEKEVKGEAKEAEENYEDNDDDNEDVGFVAFVDQVEDQEADDDVQSVSSVAIGTRRSTRRSAKMESPSTTRRTRGTKAKNNESVSLVASNTRRSTRNKKTKDIPKATRPKTIRKRGRPRTIAENEAEGIGNDESVRGRTRRGAKKAKKAAKTEEQPTVRITRSTLSKRGLRHHFRQVGKI